MKGIKKIESSKKFTLKLCLSKFALENKLWNLIRDAKENAKKSEIVSKNIRYKASILFINSQSTLHNLKIMSYKHLNN